MTLHGETQGRRAEDETPAPGGASASPPLPSRRNFMLQLGARGIRLAAGAGLLGAFAAMRSSREVPAGLRRGLGILRPPGALDEIEFLSSCVRCTCCSDACEAQCIRLFPPGAGELEGTPYILSADRACTICLECGKACPTGAIRELEDMTKAKMGVAVVDERLCVSHNGSGVCGACHTACPLKNRAITQNFRNAPVVHDDKCAGCGLCEEICIVRERRAIRVVSNRRGGKTAPRASISSPVQEAAA